MLLKKNIIISSLYVPDVKIFDTIIYNHLFFKYIIFSDKKK